MNHPNSFLEDRPAATGRRDTHLVAIAVVWPVVNTLSRHLLEVLVEDAVVEAGGQGGPCGLCVDCFIVVFAEVVDRATALDSLRDLAVRIGDSFCQVGYLDDAEGAWRTVSGANRFVQFDSMASPENIEAEARRSAADREALAAVLAELGGGAG